jgi:hypothetical protein
MITFMLELAGLWVLAAVVTVLTFASVKHAVQQRSRR